MTTDLRVAFLGNSPWSVPTLAALVASRHHVVHVATLPPRPGRRGAADVETPVATEARRLNLPLMEGISIRETAPAAARPPPAPQVLVVVAFGEFLSQEGLSLAAFGALNLHFSLLPSLRGAAPVPRAIMAGFRETGVSVMQLDEGMDTGPVIAARTVEITAGENAGSLGSRLAAIGADLMVNVLDGLADGTAEAVPQDDSAATYAPKLTRSDRVIDWGEPATLIVDQIRGCAPAPGAVTTFRGHDLKVLEAVVEQRGPQRGPGSIVEGEGFLVAADDGVLRLIQVVPSGKGPMSGESYRRGQDIRPGEVLGVG